MTDRPRDNPANMTQARFEVTIRGYVTILWRGEMELAEFITGISLTITRGLVSAWVEGAAR